MAKMPNFYSGTNSYAVVDYSGAMNEWVGYA
jgi:hypothetical protein